jgi:hypothetical protein
MASVEETAAHTHLEWDTPLFGTAIAQFEQALPYADISEAVAERLRYPERALMLSVPVKMDDGARAVFAGYRVQHSSVLGRRRAASATTLRSRSASVRRWPSG